jgi:hypothetical protein
MTPRRRRGALLLVGLAHLTTGVGASAADPTIADCLHANAAAAHLRNTHKLRAAREQLLVCASASCPGDIQAECTRRAVDVDTSIPTVVFEVKDPAGNDLTAVSVSMDGKPFLDRLDGTAVAADPGQHTFRFETPGQPPVDMSFVVFEGQKDRHEHVVVGTIPPPPPAPVAPPAVALPPRPPAVAAIEPLVPPEAPVTATELAPPSWISDGKLTVAGMVTCGAGLLGLALGTVFGIEAISKKRDAGCDSNSVCPDDGAADTLRGSRSAGNLSTAFFIAGGIVEAAGVAMWIVGRNHELQASAGIGPTGAAVRLTGSWP